MRVWAWEVGGEKEKGEPEVGEVEKRPSAWLAPVLEGNEGEEAEAEGVSKRGLAENQSWVPQADFPIIPKLLKASVPRRWNEGECVALEAR